MNRRVVQAAVIGAAVVLSLNHRAHVSTLQAAGPLVQSLTYVGKFSLPAGFEYGGRGLAFNPARNSLFASGFTRSPITAEVSIPGVGGTASILQPLTDPTEGRSGQVNPGDSNDKVAGGYLVSGNSLIVSVYAYYDGSGTATLSHFVRPLSLSTKGQVVGPVKVGPLGAGYYAGYMADVPAEWQGAFGGPALTGQAEISIVSRTSYGPAAFAFNPNNLNPSGAVPLVYYDTAHQSLGVWDHPAQGVSASNPYPYYGIADEITGLVFPQGTSSVLFFGRHGTTTCYGDGGPCGDPTDNSKGTHGYPYQPVMLVYDANDLAAVRSGALKPWDVRPAAKWVLPFSDPTGAYHISGAAYDPVTGRIYVGQFFTTGAPSVIHVFQVDGSGTTVPPPTVPPPGGSTVSPDGTRVPDVASVTDNALNVWTIGSGQIILRNGAPANGGYGSQILWYQGVIYVQGTDSTWWRWTGSAWSAFGPSSPSTQPPSQPPPTGGSGASPDGTRVPGAASVIDNALNVWTIGSGQIILRNGAPANGGYGSQILWYQGVVYVLGTDSSWWRWTGSAWSFFGSSPSSQPPPTTGGSGASPDGTRVPGAASVIDNALNVWTIGSGQIILRNGAPANGGYGSQILWYQGAIYVLGNNGSWWRWTGSAWSAFGPSSPSSEPPPVGGSGASADGTRVPGAASVIDNDLNVWTIGSDQSILTNGAPANGGYGSQILWYQGVVYVFGTDANWWRWTGSGWAGLGPNAPV